MNPQVKFKFVVENPPDDLPTFLFSLSNVPYVRAFVAARNIKLQLASEAHLSELLNPQNIAKINAGGFDLIESPELRASCTVICKYVDRSLLAKPSESLHSEISDKNGVKASITKTKFSLKIRCATPQEANKLLTNGVKAFSIFIPSHYSYSYATAARPPLLPTPRPSPSHSSPTPPPLMEPTSCARMTGCIQAAYLKAGQDFQVFSKLLPEILAYNNLPNIKIPPSWLGKQQPPSPQPTPNAPPPHLPPPTTPSPIPPASQPQTTSSNSPCTDSHHHPPDMSPCKRRSTSPSPVRRSEAMAPPKTPSDRSRSTSKRTTISPLSGSQPEPEDAPPPKRQNSLDKHIYKTIKIKHKSQDPKLSPSPTRVTTFKGSDA
ncbi:hypothetical protein Pcinc_004068 [Petrolisthes cinctipes]|uniref:Uncharacterized protein n=1 Tax=Petrolisthes cinctipes TaxID=88211 RepID=A0AAE1L0K0_PETCI|nr:hypothetical protein Pcinc_004068 [Petrolisthes cinctipes]